MLRGISSLLDPLNVVTFKSLWVSNSNVVEFSLIWRAGISWLLFLASFDQGHGRWTSYAYDQRRLQIQNPEPTRTHPALPPTKHRVPGGPAIFQKIRVWEPKYSRTFVPELWYKWRTDDANALERYKSETPCESYIITHKHNFNANANVNHYKSICPTSGSTSPSMTSTVSSMRRFPTDRLVKDLRSRASLDPDLTPAKSVASWSQGMSSIYN